MGVSHSLLSDIPSDSFLWCMTTTTDTSTPSPLLMIPPQVILEEHYLHHSCPQYALS